MTLLELSFWLCLSLVGYTYLVYPMVITLAARFRPAPLVGPPGCSAEPVSVIVAAYNEESCIGRRVGELARMLAAWPGGGELIVVSDGSTDQTAEVARAAAVVFQSEVGSEISVRVLESPVNRGKAMALNDGSAAASHHLIVFADARQTWASDAINRLVARFADQSVGAVSGDLVIQSARGVMSGVVLYWGFEKWLRRAESRFYSMASVTGSICAVRRSLFRPLPLGTILDDAYWPLLVVMEGHRVIHEEQALAYDRLPERVRDEFRRKVRTQTGIFQLLGRLPVAMLPWRNPVCWQFLSHKVFRLAIPWALMGMLLSTATLGGPLYGAAFWAQVSLYVLALVGTSRIVAASCPPAAAAASFLVLNAAAWLALWIWILRRDIYSWSKVAYDGPLRAPEPGGARISTNQCSKL
jgi:cellulose synthase/poly-beta-1,6-N-acetylglucosamine synthase-like glycosyltransferase